MHKGISRRQALLEPNTRQSPFFLVLVRLVIHGGIRRIVEGLAMNDYDDRLNGHTSPG